MADTKHNMQITTSVKDLASSELKRLGNTGKHAGASIAAGFIKAQLAIGALKVAIRSAINGLRSITTDAAKQGDAFAKMSDRLGIAVETLSAYGHVAELAGVKTQAFAIGLQRQTRRIATAAQGMGEAVGALKELGLDAAELARLTPDQQFLKLADALNDVQSNGKKVALAFKLWDAEGVANLQIVNQGTDAIRAQIREAQRYGIVWTKAQASVATAFVDAQTRFDAAISGFKKAIAIEILPGLADFLDKVSNYLANHRDAVVESVKRIASTIGNAIFTALTTVALSIARLTDRIETYSVKKALAGGLFDAAGWVGETIGLFDKNATANAKRGLLGITNEAGAAEQAILDLIEAFKLLGSEGRKLANPPPAPPGAVEGPIPIDLEAMRKVWDEQNKAIGNMRDRLIGIMPPTLTPQEKIALIPDPVEEGFFDRFRDGMQRAMDDLRAQLTPEKLGMTAIQSATQAFTGFFDAITFGAQSASDAFRQMAVSMLRQLAELANQKLFAELLGLVGLGATAGAGAGAGAGARGGTPAPASGLGAGA